MKFFDASTADDLAPIAAVLGDLQRRAAALGVEIMVVGAVARDILVRHHVGLTPERATTDIDIAVAVASWNEFDALTRPLDGPPRIPHEFRVLGTTVDIIPFGGIESTGRTIMWPNDHEMHMLGFAEAFASAVAVKLPHNVEVPVASLPAQSLLKLLAWRDRGRNNRKDAIDMRTILRAYHEGPYFDALYEEQAELLERYDFDPMTAGAAWIGQEAAALISAADRTLIRETVLGGNDALGALAADMGGGRTSDNLSLLTAYREAF
jgi:predicted nucleotidyltransferase